MSELTEVQTILDSQGQPAFAVVPIAAYRTLLARARLGKAAPDRPTIPHAVVSRMVDGASAARAWREHLQLTQETVAKRMGISQAALAQIERSVRPRPATRERLAAALRIRVEQLVSR